MVTASARQPVSKPNAASTVTARDLAERAMERRAVEAAIWGMPLVNFDSMRQAYFRDAKAKYNDVLYWSKPSDWKNQTTTPNHSTNYVLIFMNLKDGPVVVDIPAAQEEALYGTLINSWTEPLLNVGDTGEDQGKGAKYLVLPPGYHGKVPEGYVSIRCSTYNCYTLLRVITKTHSAEGLANRIAYLKRLKVYPLASGEQANRFIDIADEVFNGVPVFDMSFYESLARMVAEEPVLERDMAIMGQLHSLRIGTVQTLEMDRETTAILKRAVAEAHAYMMEGFATTGDVVWEGKRKWRRPANIAPSHSTKLTFVVPGKGISVDERSYARFAMYGPVVPPPPQLYLKTHETNKGERLNGSNTYRLRVPANVPARQFWAADVYDAETAAFIREVPVVGIDSYKQKLKKNSDGTVDIFFAQKPLAGQENNTVTTIEGKPFFLFFRFYGPEKPLIDKTWVLNDVEKVN